jgi:hypothetical protein
MVLVLDPMLGLKQWEFGFGEKFASNLHLFYF